MFCCFGLQVHHCLFNQHNCQFWANSNIQFYCRDLLTLQTCSWCRASMGWSFISTSKWWRCRRPLCSHVSSPECFNLFLSCFWKELPKLAQPLLNLLQSHLWTSAIGIEGKCFSNLISRPLFIVLAADVVHEEWCCTKWLHVLLSFCAKAHAAYL